MSSESLIPEDCLLCPEGKGEIVQGKCRTCGAMYGHCPPVKRPVPPVDRFASGDIERLRKVVKGIPRESWIHTRKPHPHA